MDIWLIDKLSRVISESRKHLNEYEYSLAKDLIEEFFLRDFCDNYIEIVKTRSYDENDKKSQLSCIYTMYNSLKIILALLAPFVPFVAEEIYSSLYSNNNDDISIHEKGNWPNLLIKIGDNLIEEGNRCLEVLDFVRKYKSNAQVSIKAQISKIILPFKLNESILGDLKNVVNTSEISINEDLDSIEIIM
jgi:valyl-tRNA synthetase